MAYTHTLQQKIFRFFEDNPEEELAYSDMLVKFDATKANLDRAISSFMADGYLIKHEHYHRGGGH